MMTNDNTVNLSASPGNARQGPDRNSLCSFGGCLDFKPSSADYIGPVSTYLGRQEVMA